MHFIRGHGTKFLAIRMEHLYIYFTSFSISQLCFMDFSLHLAMMFFLWVNGCSMTTRPQFSSVEGASGENKCGKTVVHGMWECKSKWPVMLIIYSTTIKGFSSWLLVRVPELATLNLFLLLCTFFSNFDLSHLKEGKYT